jgi:glycosyltransferase involved in cell wall biosynthesis
VRLLLITFVLDDSHPSLSWQAYVARELAEKVEELTVLTSRVGQLKNMPANVEVIVPPRRPLGLPHRCGGRWAYGLELYRICKSRGIDAVFIHMAKDWAYQLKPAFSVLNVPVAMWYAHGTVTWRLRAAAQCVDLILTSTPGGCRLNSDKVRIIGQAIDVERFSPPGRRSLDTILYIGRIARRKRVALICAVAKVLKPLDGQGDIPKVEIVGTSRTMDDLAYEYELRSDIWNERMENTITMYGHVPHERVPEFYERAFVHLNVSETGSMDKSVMEALSAGCPVLTSNSAFRETLRDYPEFVITDPRPDAIAEQVDHIYRRRHEYDPRALRALVEGRHSLYTYADRVLGAIKGLVEA